jgi:ABC-type nitrate/sulfonate/bicarbonate transport system substrate-binding protein
VKGNKEIDMSDFGSRFFSASFGLLASVLLFPSGPAGAAEKVSLAYTQTLYSAQVIIAREKGYFAKHGIDLDPKLFTAGRLTLDAVMAGAADICTTAETPMTAAVMAQRPIAIIARLAKATPTTLVHADAGIGSIQDLKGKKLGVTAGTGSEVYVYSVLEKAGLKPSDVTYVNLRPEDMPGALANRSVDAINTWQPNISNAERVLGAKATVLPTVGIYNETWNLVVMQDYLKANSRQATAMIQALLEAESFINGNRPEAMDILSRVVGVDRSVVESSWSNFEFRIALDPGVTDILQAHSRWRLATGNMPQGVTSVPDFRKVVFPAPLDAADPKRVTGF